MRGLGVEVEPGARHNGWGAKERLGFIYTGFARKRWGYIWLHVRRAWGWIQKGGYTVRIWELLISDFAFVSAFFFPSFLSLELSSFGVCSLLYVYFLISSPVAMSGPVGGASWASTWFRFGCIKLKKRGGRVHRGSGC